MQFTEKLLKIKHWQLFLAIYALPLLLYALFIVFMIALAQDMHLEEDLGLFGVLGGLLFLAILCSVIVAFSWFWAVGVTLQQKLPQEIRLKTGWFKFFLFAPFFFFSIMMLLYIGIAISGVMATSQPVDDPHVMMGVMVLIMLPFYLLSLFGAFFVMRFVAKTLKTGELQRKAHFSDYAGEFFMIWFLPIGLWILQPRINQLVDATNQSQNGAPLDFYPEP